MPRPSKTTKAKKTYKRTVKGTKGAITVRGALYPVLKTKDVIHRFYATSNKSIGLFNTGGWANTLLGDSGVNNIQFVYSLGNTYIYYGGVLYFTEVNSIGTNLAALYKKWRIKSVETTMIFTNNNSSLNTPNTALPILNCAVNETDSSAETLQTLQSYNNLMVFQLGNGAAEPPRIKFKPKASTIEAIANYAVTNGMTWMDTDYPNTPHYCLKVVTDNSDATFTGFIGYVNFYFRYEFEMTQPGV